MTSRLRVQSAILLILSLLPLSFLTIPKASATVNVEQVATGLEAPWSIAFANDGTIYVTERPGRIRVIRQGVLQPSPVATISVRAVPGDESGLLGLTLDPDFDSNRLVYVYYTYTDPQGQILNRISRLPENNGQLGDEQFLLDGIKGASIHDGGRLKIGPDGRLYATTGDATNGQLAQNLTSPNGKILRINLDGSIPSDNPDPQSPVYSYGHRHPQGLAWDASEHLIASEHGPSGFFPPACCNDEINLIQPGRNYGWPNVYGIAGNPSFVDPILSTGLDTWAPSGMTFYSASNIPEWTGKFLVATLRGRHLRVLEISFAPSAEVVSSVGFLSESYGRLRDVVQGPDGFIYVATSNRDGRGSPNSGDDKILRITGTAGLPSGSPIFGVIVLYATLAGTTLIFLFSGVRWFRGRWRSSLALSQRPETWESRSAGLPWSWCSNFPEPQP